MGFLDPIPDDVLEQVALGGAIVALFSMLGSLFIIFRNLWFKVCKLITYSFILSVE
jgi:hypothetical protein